jgi:tRNA-Thr(GGU) m(6)t(6)A37 methyltransferase TsaA
MIFLKPIATVRSPRTEVRDDHWGAVVAEIVLEDWLPAEALDGIETFSHVEVIFHFDRVNESAIIAGARHPRNNPDWPRVGIFAQRGKNRPNRLGLTTARVLHREGRTLLVQGLDAVDGTPVLDIKPVMIEFLPREPVTQPAWATKLMAEYWLE